MGRLVLGIVAAAWVLAGWRNMPRLDDPSAGAAGVMIAATCVLCYFCGRRRAYAQATAIANARAEARAAAAATSTSTAQAAVIVQLDPALGARQAAAEAHGQPEWIAPRTRAVLEASDATDSVLADVLEAEHVETG